MTQIRQLVSLMVIMIIVGCSTPNRTAYVTLGSIALTVNTSLKIYNDFYQAGKSDDITRNELQTYYLKYQAAARVAEQAQKTISDPNSTAYQQIVAIVQTTANELTTFVTKVTTPSTLTTP
jgi:hypothetical protein